MLKVICSDKLTDAALKNFDFLIGICKEWFPDYTEVRGYKLNQKPIKGIRAFCDDDTKEGFSSGQFTVYEIDGISTIADGEELGKTKLAFNSCFLKPYVREDEHGIHLTSFPPKSPDCYTCFLVTQINVHQNTAGTGTQRTLHIFLP